ncbi:MAG: helix-turn-helix domain-containing protein [Actinomycetota bacterium]
MIDPHRCYSAPEAIELTGIPRAMVYDALEAHEIEAIRRGRRWLIPGAALIRFVEELGR